ncbi:MAG: hypothetical protein JNM56_08330, partial [Planctomycetia bacterium]|nr:hypothetical protein [Planctomycetia bacterium]
MSATAEAPPGPEVWQAQNLRLTAFSQSPQFAVPQQWWREVTSSEPEHVLEKRPKQEREEAGLFQGAVFGLAFDILRVQWTAAPRLDAENIDLNNQPATLGQFIERKDWFHRLMEGWLPRCPPIHRLAFGANLLLPVENHEAGYRMLDRYLRWLEIDPQSSEILYRVNRRRPSGTGVQGL